eukprot:CAMPEP_0113631026 /NCGR_PEP_ID=MMETSP0017_2-20120614/16124_1 /TAXON_ID=2856 /ORGANISM="Cylindrotheca closterium" /LENGTH=814 /DNA_ID=CAMNT_0000541521 /DNA_START=73 /DNA_END=2513 /DNA_ORIENTATION=+ /assembly_acc=CAM_ASM_000147
MSYDDDDGAEMATLTSSGRRIARNNDSNNNQRRRGGRGGRRNNNNRRGNNEEEQRRIRKWGPRGVMRRIRGKGIPGQEGEKKTEDESLLTDENGGDGGFYDTDPYGDMDDYDEEESRPITDMGADEEDEFLDPEEYIDYSQNDNDEEDDEEVCGDGDEEDSGSEEEDGDEEEDEDAEYEEAGNGEDDQYGHYDDEYENRANGGDSSYRDGGGSYHDGDGSYHDGGEGYNNSGGSYRDGEGYNDGGGGYNDGEYRRDNGSHRSSNNGNRPRNGLLRQLSKIRRPGRRGRGRGRNSSSNLDHTNLIGSGGYSDAYGSSNNTNVSGRIEGFGSKPEVEQHRNLRQKLKAFRDKRIAARNGAGEPGMKRMSMSGDPQKKKNWIERIDNAIDAMADAALTHPGFDGYMSSTKQTITQKTKTTTDISKLSKDSYLRTQFGDDNAYIIYLEGEKVASELEVLSYKNRIKELEAEIRKLKGIEDGDEGTGNDSDSSAASDDSSNAGETDAKESEIEWQTGVPEEGVLIDIGESPQAPTFNKQRTAAVPVADLLQSPPAPTTSNEQSTAVAPVADLLQTQTEGQIEEKPSQTSEVAAAPNDAQLLSSQVEQIQQENVPGEASKKETTTEQKEDTLVDLSVRDEAKDIVDNILADLLNEKKVTSLLADDDEEDVVESLLSLKLDQSENAAAPEAQNTAPTTPIDQETTDAPEPTPMGGTSDSPPAEPPADAPPPPPAVDPPPPPADAPPPPPAVDPPPPPADAPPPPPAVDPPEPPIDDPPAPFPVDPPEPPIDDPPAPPPVDPPTTPADAEEAPEATSNAEST